MYKGHWTHSLRYFEFVELTLKLELYWNYNTVEDIPQERFHICIAHLNQVLPVVFLLLSVLFGNCETSVCFFLGYVLSSLVVDNDGLPVFDDDAIWTFGAVNSSLLKEDGAFVEHTPVF